MVNARDLSCASILAISMYHQSQPPLTHLVPPECLSGGPNDPPPTFPRAVTQSSGNTSPGGHKRPRSEDAQADDDEPLAKRERSSGSGKPSTPSRAFLGRHDLCLGPDC
ncbi:hypothetical protein BD413DRAFT_240583 [Trametes elegans]|nr:hypothetical protein BD413DRAFT_240583 [Trametes elegans]